METMTFNEAILVEIVGRDNVDQTNCISLLRRAQMNVLNQLALMEIEPAEDILERQYPLESIDQIMILVTENGSKSLFAGNI